MPFARRCHVDRAASSLKEFAATASFDHVNAVCQAFTDATAEPSQLSIEDYLRRVADGALPLRIGDQVRIEARANRPSFLYLIWIGADGIAHPVYPWRGGDWTDRAALFFARNKVGEAADSLLRANEIQHAQTADLYSIASAAEALNLASRLTETRNALVSNRRRDPELGHSDA